MIADQTHGFPFFGFEITPEVIAIFVISKVFALLLLYAAFSKSDTPKTTPKSASKPRWRSFQILQENTFSAETPAISELPKGLALKAQGPGDEWAPRLSFVNREKSVSIRFRPTFLSGGKILKAAIGNREVFTMRLNGKSGNVELEPAPPARGQNAPIWKVVGRPESQDWELRRNNRTIATAYPRPPKPDKGRDQRAFELEVLETEDPLLPLTVATGIEILRRVE